jgi:uroporphyrinogen-III synthase
MIVLLTRSRAWVSEDDDLHRILSSAGIIIEEIPMISFSLAPDLTALDSSLQRASSGEFDAIILSSPTAVYFFEERVRKLGLMDEICRNVRFGAIGEATARVLDRIGFEIQFPIPAEGGSEEFSQMLAKYNLERKPILLLQSQIGLYTLTDALRQTGALPERVTLYHTNGPTPANAARLVSLMQSDDRPDVIAFFSPSAVAHFAQTLMGTGLLNNLPTLAAIGKTTANAIEGILHSIPEILAPKADITSLANEIVEYLRLV